MSERWKPKKGEAYYGIFANGDTERIVWRDSSLDESLFELGNCFRIEEKAQAAAEKIKALLLGLHNNDNVVTLNIPDTVPKLEVDDRGVVPYLMTLPKLTTEVFSRPDCPEWAQYAAVNKNGNGFYYRNKPKKKENKKWSLFGVGDYQYIGIFDATDWHKILIERPAKLQKLTTEVFDRPDCPEWARYAVVDDDGYAYYYSKSF